MSSSITAGKTYIPYLDAAYAQESKTSFLDVGQDLVKMGENGKDMLIAKTTLVGLANHTRAGNYSAGDVTFAWETITPGYDRDRMFHVEETDNLETAGLAFGTLAGEFIRTKVVPEVDAYRFATYAGTTNISTVNGATLSNSAETIAAIRAARTTMEEDGVDLNNCYLFITPTLKGYLDDVDTTTSKEVLSSFAGVVKVPQSRFYTQIDLASGTANTAEGGFIKNSAAGKDINFMIIDKTALVQTAKHVAPKIVSPTENQMGDFWKFGYHIYGVAAVKEQKVDGIYLHKKAWDLGTATITLTSAGNAVTLVAGATLQYTGTVMQTDYDTDTYKVLYATTNASVASINASTGLATGVAAGTCNISASLVYKTNSAALDPEITDTMALEVTAG